MAGSLRLAADGGGSLNRLAAILLTWATLRVTGDAKHAARPLEEAVERPSAFATQNLLCASWTTYFLSHFMLDGIAMMKRYTFKCMRAGGPGPAIHIDLCEDDAFATHRALQLMELWPLATKVDVEVEERHFEVARGQQDPHR